MGFMLLRRVPGYTIARVLNGAPHVSLAEAIESARAGERRYVRVHGRITSDEEFPDEQNRALVYRARKLQVAERGGRWRTIEDERLAVPFGLQERGAMISIDVDALDDGLVVLPREAEGRAGEIPDRIPPDVPPDATVRHRVEQISAVDHATAAGLPRVQSGRVVLGKGLGRPLVLTTLELGDAMRVLSSGRRGYITAAAALLALGLGLAASAIVTLVMGLVARA
jgi:hypothetical protein